MYVCMSVCVPVCVCMCIRHACEYVYVHVCMCACVCMHMCMRSLIDPSERTREAVDWGVTGRIIGRETVFRYEREGKQETRV